MKAPKHIHEVNQSSSSNENQSSAQQDSQQSHSTTTTTAPTKAKAITQVRDNNDMPVTGQSSMLPVFGLVQLIIVTSAIFGYLWHKHHMRKRVEA